MTRRFQGVEGELEVYCRGSKGRNKNGAVLKKTQNARMTRARKLSVAFRGATALVVQGTSSIFRQ